MNTASERISNAPGVMAEIDVRSEPGSKIRHIEGLIVPFALCLAAAPMIAKWLGIMAAFLLQGDSSHLVFIPLDLRSNILSLIWMGSVCLSTTLSIGVLIARHISTASPNLEQRLLDGISICMLAGLLAFMAHQGIFNSSGAEIGSTLLALQAGSAYCLFGLYILNRLNRAKHLLRTASKDGEEEFALFSNQTLIIALTPLMLRTGYGLWYGLFGTWGEASFGQQFLLVYCVFLVPLGLTLHKQSNYGRTLSHPTLTRLLPYVALAAILFGTFSYINTGLSVDMY